MIQIKIENNKITKIISSKEKYKGFIEIKDSFIVKPNHDSRIFNEDFTGFLTPKELEQRGVDIDTRYLFDPHDYFFIRVLPYTEPYVKNETTEELPLYNEGFIPIFINNNWEIVEDNFWKPIYKEVNYNAGRLMSTFEISDFHIRNYDDQLKKIKEIPRLFSPSLSAFKVSQKIKHTFNLIQKFIQNYEKTNNPFFDYHHSLEDIIFQMKSVLDMLSQLSYVLCHRADIITTHKLEIDSLGQLLAKYNKEIVTDETRIIFGDAGLYKTDKTGFLNIINDLFNSMKHCLIHSEVFMQVGHTNPSVLSLYSKHNNFSNEIAFHNHNFYHLVMGFQDNIVRILDNFSKYIEQNYQ